ncbi:UDP-N-acetylglucosamine transporter YEA4 protein [Rutstroemia sp. NJR-2017a BVV2]|nr:UDP-N-acetylglucosamine transporter YEA4 protein [Rutstroemia sp. NJR-2017a BVV2]
MNRSTLRDLQASSNLHHNQTDGDVAPPKVINAAPSLEKAEMYGIDDQRPASSKMLAMAGRIFIETIPQWLAVGAMLGLIFGGCCSNVSPSFTRRERGVIADEGLMRNLLGLRVGSYCEVSSTFPALNHACSTKNPADILYRVEPDSGTLMTFVQFLFVAVTGYISQFDQSRPPLFLQPNRVPIRRWIINIVLFFTINVLNNHAFSYNISVPMHIILRSGGSITTLAAGYIWGKRFSRIQVVAVTLLTIGVVTAAWSDQQSKDGKVDEDVPPFSTGLVILFVAQVLSAIMGLYTEETYKEYGPHWKENLFYSHLLALPLFAPFIPSMHRQLLKLAASAPLTLPTSESLSSLPPPLASTLASIHLPSQLVYLAMNVLTQYACIRGVNLLAAASSALTVTIVLNVRKLVSLLLSIWLFGNRLSPGTMLGACLVFFAGGLYSLDGGKKKKGVGIGARHRGLNGNAKVSAGVNGKVG